MFKTKKSIIAENFHLFERHSYSLDNSNQKAPNKINNGTRVNIKNKYKGKAGLVLANP